MTEWMPDLSASDRPRYLAIADVIEADLRSGRLSVGDRLPPQRRLAERLGIDFTTVARGYSEAHRRGLVESRVGQGTYVRALPRPDRETVARGQPRRADVVDLTMNLPPEPDDPALIARMQAGLEAVGRDLVALLRYQDFGGAPADKDAASIWLGRRGLVPAQERLMVTPGAHAALMGILGVLASAGDVVLAEEITYPGVRSIAAQLGLKLAGLPMDDDGIDPDALADACRRLAPKALYLNPTLQNPTTLTIPQRRREEIVTIARRFGVPIVEDDAYGFIPAQGPAPFAALAPDLTWHVAGLAKCIGAGLRAAYVVAPSARAGWPFTAAVRTATVMASPVTVALATRWIEDGTADALLRFIRAETAARQQLAAEVLAPDSFRTDPASFNLWVPLPAGWTRSAFIGQMRSTGIGVVASDAFAVGVTPPEAVRLCLGGPTSRADLRRALEYMAHALSEQPAVASTYL
ncbi:PLP-dependent aminotransferase family protein [Tistrella mobilis]|nr:PLP-dependent aminotransferase family protein [Tistrella mobilis]